MIFKDIIYPQALKPNDVIGIFSPSSIIDEDRFHQGIAILHAQGFRTKIHPQTFYKNLSSAGFPNDKANALHDLITDNEVNVIMAACGGNHAVHFLDLIDYNLIRKYPKLIGGFSDVTALSCALYSKAKISSFHAPTIQSLTRIDDISLSSIKSGINEISFLDSQALKTGTASGTLLGGNLAMLSSLLGTDYAPNFENAILFIEDINEELSRIDRMLWQLRNALPFEKLSGIIFGEFLNAHDTGRPFGFTLDEIIDTHTKHLTIPILKNAPIGHGARNIALHVGRQVKLNITPHSAQLTYQ